VFTLNIPHQGFAVSRSKVACAETVTGQPVLGKYIFALICTYNRGALCVRGVFFCSIVATSKIALLDKMI
jgi:hypothetical protein